MKRTRVLTKPQSRNGCYTPKDRKVRCDEERPACLRCLKAGRICEGYPAPRNSESPQRPDVSVVDVCTNFSPSQSTTLFTIDDSLHGDLQGRCLRALDTTGLERPGSSALREVLRYNSNYPPSATPALQALEALRVAIDRQYVVNEKSLMTYIDNLYGRSMHKLSDELSEAQSSSIALFIPNMLLLAIELLQRRRQNGLKHGTGAIQSQLLSRKGGHESDSIAYLCRIYDLASLLYCEGVRLPRMAAVDPGSLHGCGTADNVELEHRCIEALHHAHSFIARVHHDTFLTGKISHESTAPSYIEPLEVAQRVLDARLATLDDIPSRPVFLVLRNLFTMTIVQLKQLYNSCESQWDLYLDEFGAIVKNADAFLQGLPAARGMESRPFSLLIGVIPPLQMVTLKCRHLTLRTQAITQLNQAGCEGPFIGAQIAAIANACIEIEGQLPRPSSPTAPISSHLPPRDAPQCSVQLPEDDIRVSGCSLLDNNGMVDEAGQPHPFNGWTRIRLLRRGKPCQVIQANVLTSTAFRSSPEFRHLQDQQLDPAMWERWTQAIHFGSPGPDKHRQLRREDVVT